MVQMLTSNMIVSMAIPFGETITSSKVTNYTYLAG